MAGEKEKHGGDGGGGGREDRSEAGEADGAEEASEDGTEKGKRMDEMTGQGVSWVEVVFQRDGVGVFCWLTLSCRPTILSRPRPLSTNCWSVGDHIEAGEPDAFALEAVRLLQFVARNGARLGSPLTGARHGPTACRRGPALPSIVVSPSVSQLLDYRSSRTPLYLHEK